jgi:hypothetical protein
MKELFLLIFGKWCPRWNDIDRGKPKNSETNLYQCLFVHHKSHWIDLGANLGRRGERPATNRLSHVTEKFHHNQLSIFADETCRQTDVISQLYIHSLHIVQMTQMKHWECLKNSAPVLHRNLALPCAFSASLHPT